MIETESEPGKGSVFHVLLPSARAPGEPQEVELIDAIRAATVRE